MLFLVMRSRIRSGRIQRRNSITWAPKGETYLVAGLETVAARTMRSAIFSGEAEVNGTAKIRLKDAAAAFASREIGRAHV